jgi:hypothetical protein
VEDRLAAFIEAGTRFIMKPSSPARGFIDLSECKKSRGLEKRKVPCKFHAQLKSLHANIDVAISFRI